LEYLIVKWVHILSSTLLFGTGLGSAFYMFFASRTRDPKVIAVVVRHVVIADWIFTTPTVVLQPLSGWYLVRLAGFPWSATWLSDSIVLYCFAIACWLPVVWLQVRMRNMARQAADRNEKLPERYWRYMAGCIVLGTWAFIAFVTVFYLMVAKPY
jgi:uncharacterized membrane protein